MIDLIQNLGPPTGAGPDGADGEVFDPAVFDGLFDGPAEPWEFPDLGVNWQDFRPAGFDSLPAVSDLGGGPNLRRPQVEETTWLPVILLGVVAAGSLVLWRFWPRITGRSSAGPRPVAGLGPWPVDPRTIADREGLVRAFEYLSVLLCGAGARAWNHVAIAAALRTTAGAGDAAEPLARAYALARYAPAGEPLPPVAVAEARRHLCRLAGVPAP